MMTGTQHHPSNAGEQLVRDLFDFKFSNLVTVRAVRIWYGLSVAGVGAYSLLLLVMAFALMSVSPGGGFFALLFVPVFAFGALLTVRVVLETFVVIHRLGDDVRRMSTSAGPPSAPPASPLSAASPPSSSPAPPVTQDRSAAGSLTVGVAARPTAPDQLPSAIRSGIPPTTLDTATAHLAPQVRRSIVDLQARLDAHPSAGEPIDAWCVAASAGGLPRLLVLRQRCLLICSPRTVHEVPAGADIAVRRGVRGAPVAITVEGNWFSFLSLEADVSSFLAALGRAMPHVRGAG